MVDFLKWFRKSEPVEEPKMYEIQADIQLKRSPTLESWRTGMWVVCNKRIAILHVLQPTTAEIHYVDNDTGITILVENVPLNALRQAHYSEIPQCRRDNFPADLAARYGYGN